MTARAAALRNILHYGILLLVLYVLQTMIFPHLRIFGSVPLLIPLAVVGAGLLSGSCVGGIFGLVAGILCDMSMIETTVLFAVLMTALGIVTGILGESALAQGFPSYLVCSVAALIVIAVSQMFGLVAYHGVSLGTVFSVALRQTLCSLIFVIPVYWAVRGVSRRTAKDY